MVPPVNLAPYILQCESRIVMTSAQGESMTFVSTRWVNDLCPYKVSQWPLSLQGEPMTLWLLLKVSQWPKVPPVNTSPYILNCESRMFITSAQSESMTFVQYKMRQWPLWLLLNMSQWPFVNLKGRGEKCQHVWQHCMVYCDFKISEKYSKIRRIMMHILWMLCLPVYLWCFIND